jgi:hypothetical protein
VAARLGTPILESVVPRLMEDPAYRMALADELMDKRVAKWPIVNVIHVLLGPLVSLARRRLPIAQQNALAGAEEMVGNYLASLPTSRGETVEVGAGRSAAAVVQSTFAYLQQSNPMVGRLYANWKLWEPMAAQAAEAELRRRLSVTVERQRTRLREQFGSGGPIGALVRIILTIGALLWFPIVQPVAEAMLAGHAFRDLTLLAVQLFGVTYLLKSVAFLLIYFVLLWMILRWHTQRQIDRFLSRWKDGRKVDATLSLAGQALEWLNELLSPIRSAVERLQSVVRRADQLKKSL